MVTVGIVEGKIGGGGGYENAEDDGNGYVCKEIYQVDSLLVKIRHNSNMTTRKMAHFFNLYITFSKSPHHISIKAHLIITPCNILFII